MIRLSSYISLCICLFAFKFLHLKSYISTDFDVHRNWMAITYNLPLKEWYFDETSEWTLDYPPLFAFFEWALAHLAGLLNITDALLLTKSSTRSDTIVFYQKLTVSLSDIVYYYAVYRMSFSLESFLTASRSEGKSRDEKSDSKNTVKDDKKHQYLIEAIYHPDVGSTAALLLLAQPGLLLVDHIHFQYNGLLSGMFILAISAILEEKYCEGSFWYSIILNWKHIYLYCAPAFGMHLLAGYCFVKVAGQPRYLSFVKRITKLGLVVASVFLATYLPFSDPKTLKQIASRLFPFKRGLTHAYWAPNIWSLYNSLDKLFATVLKIERPVLFNLDSISGIRPSTSTSGLVQEYEHLYLPSVIPTVTFALVAVFTLPLIVKFIRRLAKPSPYIFMKAVALSSLTSFMFGWHVHEKAIIVALLPIIPVSIVDKNLRIIFLRLSLAGTYSLFPLLFPPAEYLTKVTVLIAYYGFAKSINQTIDSSQGSTRAQVWYYNFRKLFDQLFVLVIVFVELYGTFIHGKLDFLGRINRLNFLPLMLTSSVSAVGITFSYLELYCDLLFGKDHPISSP